MMNTVFLILVAAGLFAWVLRVYRDPAGSGPPVAERANFGSFGSDSEFRRSYPQGLLIHQRPEGTHNVSRLRLLTHKLPLTAQLGARVPPGADEQPHGIRTGDATFDGRVVAHGDRRLADILGDATIRALVLKGVDATIALRGGVLEWTGTSRQAWTMDMMLALADALEPSSQGTDLGGDVERYPPESPMRMLAARRLWTTDPSHALALGLATEVSGTSSDSMIRADALDFIRSRPALERVSSVGLGFQERLRAIGELPDHANVPADAVTRVAEQAPRPMSAQTVEALRKLGRTAPVEDLRGLLANTPGVVRLVAQSAALAGAAGVPLLVELLQVEGPMTPDVCEALGRCGDRTTLEHLRPLTKGAFRTAELKRAAEAAIETILEHRGGSPTGSLSLAQTQESDGNLYVSANTGLEGALESVE